MTRSFTKIFSSLTESTVWSEPYPTRILWVSMLAMADRSGCVYASVPGLARRAGITLDECEVALTSFLGPDKYSRTKEHDGRRIKEVDGGWQLLNYTKYREMRDEDAKREADAIRQRNHRAAKRDNDDETESSNQPPDCHAKSVTKRDSHTKSHEVAQAEAEADNNNTPLTPRRGEVSKNSDDTANGFVEFWQAYPRKVSKPHALTAWRKLKLDTQALPAILAGLERAKRSAQWQRDGGQFIPHPATWLNGRRWEDADATETPTTSEPAGFSLEDALSAQGVVQ